MKKWAGWGMAILLGLAIGAALALAITTHLTNLGGF